MAVHPVAGSFFDERVLAEMVIGSPESSARDTLFKKNLQQLSDRFSGIFSS
jgi:hypothetical protein